MKNYVCYRENCWKTDFTIIQKAAQEEEHPGEELSERITPHSHEENPDPESEDLIYHSQRYQITANNQQDSYTKLNATHDHYSLDVNEFLYEYAPTGGVRQTGLTLSLKGQLLKKGILSKYLETKFNMY